jgi:hypothetical protein
MRGSTRIAGRRRREFGGEREQLLQQMVQRVVVENSGVEVGRLLTRPILVRAFDLRDRRHAAVKADGQHVDAAALQLAADLGGGGCEVAEETRQGSHQGVQELVTRSSSGIY